MTETLGLVSFTLGNCPDLETVSAETHPCFDMRENVHRKRFSSYGQRTIAVRRYAYSDWLKVWYDAPGDWIPFHISSRVVGDWSSARDRGFLSTAQCPLEVTGLTVLGCWARDEYTGNVGAQLHYGRLGTGVWRDLNSFVELHELLRSCRRCDRLSGRS